MSAYQDNFEKWADVMKEFRADEPEPDEVLLAQYTYEDYDGRAAVFYRNGRSFFWVDGGHCSCDGLEGQWAPIEYDAPTLIAALEKHWRKDDFASVIEKLRAFNA